MNGATGRMADGGLDAADVYFDAQLTGVRYLEKPSAPTLAEALEIVQLRRLVDGGFFWRILSVRGESAHLATLFRLASEAGLFPDAGLAAGRMKGLP